MNRRMRFGCGHVCQHDPPWAGDVANGIHAGDRRFQRIVDDDPPALVSAIPASANPAVFGTRPT
ncbi:MAG: hypothetical protein ACLSAH_11300 [Bilophila wadsworthia]